jgi:hypothetical protein
MATYYPSSDTNTIAIQDITAQKAIIDEATIKPKVQKPTFKSLLIAFFIGAMSFAVALSYNNFAESLIKSFSLSGGIIASIINLIVLTGVVLGVIYLVWTQDPETVSAALL